jgi:hypothetical protein
MGIEILPPQPCFDFSAGKTRIDQKRVAARGEVNGVAAAAAGQGTKRKRVIAGVPGRLVIP